MHCEAFESGRCASCSEIAKPYPQQLAAKQHEAQALLAAFDGLQWLEPVASPEQGFRNKAKMVVAGSMEEPTLGILDARGQGVDLGDCPLYPEAIRTVFPALRSFIAMARIVPYDVPGRHGELKYLLITLDEATGALMLRFVLRSTESLPRIRKYLPILLEQHPNLRVVSVNLQPQHAAVLEGEQEIVLTGQDSLPMHVNGFVLHLRPKSFFQTNTHLAEALYRQARDWVDEAAPKRLWDLYCGVGGFALHCADGVREVTGIEISGEAIASANRSRDEQAIANLSFRVGDSTAFAREAGRQPDLVIVNPPRRGIGPELARVLDEGEARFVVYSSCNPRSLAQDLAAMRRFVPVKARMFDLFPHTRHCEVLCLLRRRG